MFELCYNRFGDRMEKLLRLFDQLSKYRVPEYENFPEIDLYMDQVLTYIDKYMPSYLDQNNKLTASMINNYVKDKVIDAPISKKYDKQSLASLIIIANLKRVLPINDIKVILTDQNETIESLYNAYEKTLNDVTFQMATDAKSIIESTDEQRQDLKMLALRLALDASIKSYIAHVILQSDLLALSSVEDSHKDKKQKKKKQKSTKEVDDLSELTTES